MLLQRIQLAALAIATLASSMASALAPLEPVDGSLLLGPWYERTMNDTPSLVNARLQRNLTFFQVDFDITQEAPGQVVDPTPEITDQAMEQVEATGTDAWMYWTIYPKGGLNSVTDAMLDDLAQRVAKAITRGHKLFLRYAPEMNGNWFAYGQQPDLFKSHWRHFVTYLRDKVVTLVPGASRTETLNSFAFIWAPNSGNGYPFRGGKYENKSFTDTLTEKSDPYTPYYPGDDVVDWVGLSIYHYGTHWPWRQNVVPKTGAFQAYLRGDTPEPPSPWQSFGWYDFYGLFSGDGQGSLGLAPAAPVSAGGKPFFLAETGATFHYAWNMPVWTAEKDYDPSLAPPNETSTVTRAEMKREWWTQIFDAAGKFSQLKAVCAFEFIKSEEDTLRDFTMFGPPPANGFPVEDGEVVVALRADLDARAASFVQWASPKVFTTSTTTTTSSTTTATGAATTVKTSATVTNETRTTPVSSAAPSSSDTASAATQKNAAASTAVGGWKAAVAGLAAVAAYWDGNVEVFLGFGNNPTEFPYKLGEQPVAKAGEAYTIPLDFSQVPSNLLTPGVNMTLQTICHFSISPKIDLFQCADLIAGSPPASLTAQLTAVPTLTRTRATRPTTTVAPDQVFIADVEDAAEDIRSFIEIPKGCLISEVHMKPTDPSRNLAALWLRAAFHDVATYDPTNHPNDIGGADGSLVSMLDRPEHAGINNSIATKFVLNKNSSLSAPDLISLAAVVTVAHCGGPSITFEAGRKLNPKPIDPKGRVPEDTDRYENTKKRLQDMGLSNEDIVALVSGGHTLGGAHKAISPHLNIPAFQPFDTTPGIFDNDIFKQLLDNRCVTNIDCAIAADPDMIPHIRRFAGDQAAFFKAFESAYVRMTRLPWKTALTGVREADGHVHLEVPKHRALEEEGRSGTTVPVRVPATTAGAATATAALTTTATAKSGAAGTKCTVASAFAAGVVGVVLAGLW
ncbi:hypothetical protein HDU96_006523 [Phlyctochytrium bullatum]|nr:hypothetical protein HDU96_006523 [Phlyctochytrium bullatum]